MDKFSYTYGNKTRDVRYNTVPNRLDYRAMKTPGKPAYIFRMTTENSQSETLSREILTFGDLAAKSMKLAAAFLSVGLKERDRILILDSNTPEYLLVDFACVRISVLMIRLGTSADHLKTLPDVLKKHRVQGLVIEDNAMESKINAILPGLLSPCSSESAAKYGTQSVSHIFYLKSENRYGTKDKARKSVGDLLLESQLDENRVVNIQRQQDPDDVAFIFPTSGSTGPTKFVMHSHYSYPAIISPMHEAWFQRCGPTFVYFNIAPFSRSGARTLLPILLGTVHVCHDLSATKGDRGVQNVIDVAREEAATCMYVQQSVLYKLIKMAKSVRLPPLLQNIEIGGEQHPTTLLNAATRLFEHVSFGYGSTESPHIASRRLTEKINAILSAQWLEPDPFVEIKITDQQKQAQPRGEQGYIHVRTRYQLVGYLDDPVATERAISPSGWFQTGDIGLLNAEGQLRVIGRSNDIILRDNTEVYPSLLEDMIAACPGVDRVAVVGVADEKLCNEMCAFVIPDLGSGIAESDIRIFCQQRVTEDGTLVVPMYILLVDDFPYGQTRKIDRTMLKATATQKLRLMVQ